MSSVAYISSIPGLYLQKQYIFLRKGISENLKSSLNYYSLLLCYVFYMFKHVDNLS